jgi:hypothetical protein
MPPPEYTFEPKTYGDQRNQEIASWYEPRWWTATKDYSFLAMIVALAMGVEFLFWLAWFAILVEPVGGMPDIQEV